MPCTFESQTMLMPNYSQKYLTRFDELIAEGQAMLQKIKLRPGEYYSPRGYGSLGEQPVQAPDEYVLDNSDNFKKWIINYKSLLEQVIPINSAQRKLIEEPGICWDVKNNIEIHIVALKAIREDYEKGLLCVPQSGISSFNLEDVSELLRRVPAGLRRWTWEKSSRTKGGEARQWHIDNEYHVQNLVYFLLAPLFPDIKEEEYTRSVGQKHPKVDLEIPSLKLVIEIKFWYPQNKPQRIIGEIAEDTSLYFAEGSPHEHIIPFIWDDFRRTEEHDLLTTGLKRLNRVLDVVIVSRPSFMPESKGVGDEGGDE